MENMAVNRAMSDSEAFDRLLRTRHSCRAFLPDAVDRAVIEQILLTAQLAPSWCNTQPWKVTIMSGEATDAFRAAMLAHAATSQPEPDIAFPSEYRGLYLERRRVCGLQLYDAVGIARGDRTASARQARENFRLFGAPHAAIVTTDAALGQYGVLDCGAYVNSFMLAAESHGVSCITQAALAAYSPFIRAYLGVPDERVIVCGISFGYKDTNHPANGFRTARAPLDEIIDWRG